MISRDSKKYLQKLQKQSKSTGILWIERKIRAMEKILPIYGIFMAHIEPLSQTDSQALKRVEIKKVVRKWFHGNYPMHLAMFFSLLTPIQVFSLTTQCEVHEPVDSIKRINESFWTIGKLKILIFYKISKRSNIGKQWRI